MERNLEEYDSAMRKAVSASVPSYVGGNIMGWAMAKLKGVSRGDKTLLMMGSQGRTLSAIGGVYEGVKQLAYNYRGNKDYYNNAIAGFATGVSVAGVQERSIPLGIVAGVSIAIASVFSRLVLVARPRQ